jgi:putative membrane protein
MKAPIALFATSLLLGACADYQSQPATGSGSGAAPTPSARSSAVDTQTYLNQAAAADMFEIESSQLALQKSSNPAVQALARQMVEDHTRSAAKMQSVGSAAGLKSQVNAVGGVAAQNLMQLRNLSGPEFDRMYLAKQAEAHEQAYNIHSGYAAHGETPQLRTLASEMATLIQQHRNHVHQASARVQ